MQGVNEPFILLGQTDKREDNDGFLTMSKVLGLELRADMVVLSVCLTGRGKVMEGEGVVNFALAFQHAGAKRCGKPLGGLLQGNRRVHGALLQLSQGRKNQIGSSAPGPQRNQVQIPQPVHLGTVHYSWGGVIVLIRHFING